MRIKNINIKNFRNIVSASVAFNNVNIITGKNSSGKTNFLLALSHCLSTKPESVEYFGENIVTYHQGKKTTTISTTIEIPILRATVFHDLEKKLFICPTEFIFENTISKSTLSAKLQKLIFTGITKEFSPDHEITGSDIKKFFELKPNIIKKTVYVEEFTKSYLDDESQQDVLQTSKTQYEDGYRFKQVFNDFSKHVYSWTENEIFSSNLIYKKVIERNTIDTYEDVYRKIKQKISPNFNSFKKFKFIFLLADIQRNTEVKESFKRDLQLFTQGIIKDIYINTKGSVGNKGEIIVETPNGPKDIFSISTGTAVLLFFITYKNWINLRNSEKTYEAPYVMIFDEVDSIVHPSLIRSFCELLNSISLKTQLFITSHSPHFINQFSKKQIFLVKDDASLIKRSGVNRSNIYSYYDIINSLDSKDRRTISKMESSYLFVENIIDMIFPRHE